MHTEAMKAVRDALMDLPDDVIYDQAASVLEANEDAGPCLVCIAGAAVAVLDYDGDFLEAAIDYDGDGRARRDAVFRRARELLEISEEDADELFRAIKMSTPAKRAAGAISRMLKGEVAWPSVYNKTNTPW